MKLLGLSIENYGIYSGRQLDFGSSQLQVIYGPNESGKSTLLQLIRETLFGFPHRDTISLPESNGRPAASLRLELVDGRQLEVRREKSRKKSLLGQFDGGGPIVEESAWNELLGGVSPNLYQHIFGFSLKELSSGEESLKSADLADSLYGSGLGNLGSFQSLLKSLTEQRDKLYKPTGKNPPINATLAEIRTLSAALRDHQLRPRDYRQHVKERDDQRQVVSELNEQLNHVRRESLRLQNLSAAQTHVFELREVERQLEELDGVVEIPPGLLKEFQQLDDRLPDQTEMLDKLERQQEHLETEQNQLKLEPQLLQHRGEIEQLYRDVNRIRSMVRDIPIRQREAEADRAFVREGLRQIDPNWALEDLDSLRVPLGHRATIEELAEEHDALIEREKRLTSLLDGDKSRIDELQRRLHELGPEKSPQQLEQLVENALQRKGSTSRIDTLTGQMTALSRKLEIQHAQLLTQVNLDDDTQLDKLALPYECDLEESEQRLQELQVRQQRCAESIAETVEHRQRREDDLERLVSSKPVPDRETLEQTRDSRNEAWQTIRQHWTKETKSELKPAERIRTADELQRLIDLADQIADERQQSAETVAHIENLTRELKSNQKQLDKLNLDAQQLADEQSKIDEAWNQLWAPAGIEARSPRAMRSWLQERQEYLSELNQLDLIRSELDETRSVIDSLTGQLMEALGTSQGDFNSLIQQAQQTIHDENDRISTRRLLNSELQDLNEQFEQRQRENQTLVEERQHWEQRWTQATALINLPLGDSVRSARKVLNQLVELSDRLSSADLTERRVQDMQDELHEFAEQVRRLTESIGESAQQLTGADDLICEQLFDRLGKAQTDQTRFEHSQRELNELNVNLQTQREKVRLTRQRHEQILTQLGMTDGDALRRAAERFEEDQQLRGKKADLQSKIGMLRGTADEETFLKDVFATDAETLQTELESSNREESELDQRCGQAREQLGVLEARLQGYGGDSMAARDDQQRQSKLSHLESLMNEYAPLVIATQLIHSSKERFESENQPALLQQITDILQRMTGGRYVEIRRRLDENQTFVLVTKDGTERDPSQLSTGTREQLYLAIRLAYLMQYCEQNEPLPVVMDDVLVNFDEQRARQTLDVMLDLDDSLQILFLTCHPHMLRIISESQPTADILHLQPSDDE